MLPNLIIDNEDTARKKIGHLFSFGGGKEIAACLLSLQFGCF